MGSVCLACNRACFNAQSHLKYSFFFSINLRLRVVQMSFKFQNLFSSFVLFCFALSVISCLS